MLQGLDYFAANGAKGLDDLISIIDKLVDLSKLDSQEGHELKSDLKEGKLYIKDDFKVSHFDDLKIKHSAKPKMRS